MSVELIADPIDTPPWPPGLPATFFGSFATTSFIIADAAIMDEAALAQATLSAYRHLCRSATKDGRHLVRVWNYIPAITADAGPGRDRYMAFNAGRYAGLCEWFGEDRLIDLAPAATGVGTRGPNAVIRALSTTESGQALQNPDQTPAVHYSARYGPRPPCFARAMRVGRTLFVSGTAAIRGEDTVAGDLAAQLDLTLRHLATLAGGLGRYASLRAYVPDAACAEFVARRLRSAVGRLATIELVHAALCRRELAVEIEGVAEDIA